LFQRQGKFQIKLSKNTSKCKKRMVNQLQRTVLIKLLPTNCQRTLLKNVMLEYISLVNKVSDMMIAAKKKLKLSTKDVFAKMPSALKNQAIRDGKSLYARSKKKRCVAKKPVAIWNNQNYKIKIEQEGRRAKVSLPVFIDGKSKRINIPCLICTYGRSLLVNDLGTLRISKKNHKWMAQVSVRVSDVEFAGTNVMGVDLGLKVPAVGVTNTGKTMFFGNGRQNKYERRKHQSIRAKLGKKKKLKAIKKYNNKEQRWMRDKDHKIARWIIKFAFANNVSLIRLEDLSEIRNTARTSRKNAKNLHKWSFYRLARYIEYKAKIAGMKVEYVDPKYTSKKCPECKKLNTAIKRRYRCKCGFEAHRDRVGAINIINATVVDGKVKNKSLPARAAICTGVGRGAGTPVKSPLFELKKTTDSRNELSDYS